MIKRFKSWGYAYREYFINPIVQKTIDIIVNYPIDPIANARFKSMDSLIGWDANGCPVEEEIKDEL